MRKQLDISDDKPVEENVKDLVKYGDPHTFKLLCKASSQAEGWMKSTKVCNVPGGCVMQVTTQQENPDGSYALAEAITFIPNVHITEHEPRVLIRP